MNIFLLLRDIGGTQDFKQIILLLGHYYFDKYL